MPPLTTWLWRPLWSVFFTTNDSFYLTHVSNCPELWAVSCQAPATGYGTASYLGLNCSPGYTTWNISCLHASVRCTDFFSFVQVLLSSHYYHLFNKSFSLCTAWLWLESHVEECKAGSRLLPGNRNDGMMSVGVSYHWSPGDRNNDRNCHLCRVITSPYHTAYHQLNYQPAPSHWVSFKFIEANWSNHYKDHILKLKCLEITRSREDFMSP